MSIIKLPLMDKEEIHEIISQENICRIAFIDGAFPYIAPFQYTLRNNTFYFHFTDYGKKKSILTKNNRVCISIEQFKPNMREFRFISIQGRLEPVTEKNEKRSILEILFKKAKSQFSENFMAVHGFNQQNRVKNSLLYDKLTVFKLEELKERIGLRSLNETT